MNNANSLPDHQNSCEYEDIIAFQIRISANISLIFNLIQFRREFSKGLRQFLRGTRKKFYALLHKIELHVGHLKRTFYPHVCLSNTKSNNIYYTSIMSEIITCGNNSQFSAVRLCEYAVKTSNNFQKLLSPYMGYCKT